MHCFHMIVTISFPQWSIGCFRQFFFIWETKKVVAGCIRQVVVLYSNNCMGICLGGRSTGHLKEVVILKRWLFEQVWLYIENLTSGLGGMKVIWMPLKMKTLLRVRNQNLLKETGFIWFWAIIWSPFWTLFICFFFLEKICLLWA